MSLSIFGSYKQNYVYGFGFAVGSAINISTIFLEKAYRHDQSEQNSFGKKLWKVFDYIFPCGTEQKSVFRFYSPWAIPLISLIAKVILVGFVLFKDIFLNQNRFTHLMNSQIAIFIIMDIAILYIPYQLKSIYDKFGREMPQ